MGLFFFLSGNIKATLSKEIQAFHELSHLYTHRLPEPPTHTKTPTNTYTRTHLLHGSGPAVDKCAFLIAATDRT